MRILFLSPRQSWPANSGAKLRDYYLAQALGRRADLTYVFFSEPGSVSPRPADLPFCRRIVSVPSPRLYTPPKIVRGFLGRWPLPVVNYTSDEMKAALAAVLRADRFDLVHLDSIHLAAYVSGVRQAATAPVVYDWHNIESELMRRYCAGVRSPLRKLYAAWTAHRWAALEKQILLQAFGHAVCSERERAQLLDIVPNARVAVIENGVDTAFFAAPPASSNRCRIVFVGSMRFHANIEAAVWFVRSVWPRIRERFPAWRLTLVGYDPAPAVLALRGEANVEVTGTVRDVRPYYREALAAIVPLRTGGGTRLKILEAMAAGVPVVSTALGAEGLAVSPGRHLLIADRQEDWLRLLSALSLQDDLWKGLVTAGQDLVQTRYDWEILGNTLFETYSQWLNR
ncbi:MAG: glycosyltransferase [Acidobacteriia bacterium]|nr:glycosyltransferase [Terriglobia bacterium]